MHAVVAVSSRKVGSRQNIPAVGSSATQVKHKIESSSSKGPCHEKSFQTETMGDDPRIKDVSDV